MDFVMGMWIRCNAEISWLRFTISCIDTVPIRAWAGTVPVHTSVLMLGMPVHIQFPKKPKKLKI